MFQAKLQLFRGFLGFTIPNQSVVVFACFSPTLSQREQDNKPPQTLILHEQKKNGELKNIMYQNSANAQETQRERRRGDVVVFASPLCFCTFRSRSPATSDKPGSRDRPRLTGRRHQHTRDVPVPELCPRDRGPRRFAASSEPEQPAALETCSLRSRALSGFVPRAPGVVWGGQDRSGWPSPPEPSLQQTGSGAAARRVIGQDGLPPWGEVGGTCGFVRGGCGCALANGRGSENTEPDNFVRVSVTFREEHSYEVVTLTSGGADTRVS